MNKKDMIKPLIENALKNYIKPGVMDLLIELYNASCQKYNADSDMFYNNDDDTVDYLLSGLTPSDILRYVSKDFKTYDAFIAIDGYGHLYSFHFNHVVDLLTDNADFLDYVVEYVDIATLNKLNQLADQDTNKILQNAYTNGVK